MTTKKRAKSRPVDGLVRLACDGCKHQREDGHCRKPGRAWRMSANGASCFVKANGQNEQICALVQICSILLLGFSLFQYIEINFQRVVFATVGTVRCKDGGLPPPEEFLAHGAAGTQNPPYTSGKLKRHRYPKKDAVHDCVVNNQLREAIDRTDYSY